MLDQIKNVIPIKPYKEYPDGLLYCGDCLKIMKFFPEKSMDLVLTDPPYGLNYNNGDLANYWERVFGGNINKEKSRPIQQDDERTSLINFKHFIKISNNILVKGGCCCCCCGGGGPKPLFAKWTLIMDRYIGFKQAVVWDKIGLGMGIQFRRSYEFLLVAQNGSPSHRWNGGKNTSNIWRLSKIIPSKNQHPTIKPIILMKKPILLFSNKNDLILDPFLGSGTTAVACVELNRKFIGIEISEEYCKIADKRIMDAYEKKKQGELIFEVPKSL